MVEEEVEGVEEVESGAPPPLVDEWRVWKITKPRGARRHSWWRGEVVCRQEHFQDLFRRILIIHGSFNICFALETFAL